MEKFTAPTLFPERKSWARRKCWIAYTLTPKGVLTLDDGASRALASNGKSLLPSGIVDVDGDFGVGAAVALQNRKGEILGIGLVNYSAAAIRSIKGLKSSHIKTRLGEKPYDEVIHRDNLVITDTLEM